MAYSLFHIGILVCQPQKILDHKKNEGWKADGNYCYWKMTRFPKKIKDALFPETTGRYSMSAKAPGAGTIYDEDDRIFEDFEVRLYFAVKGIVRGFFVCKACDKNLTELRFQSEDWHSFEEIIHIKPSQGWRYFDV